MKFTKSLLVLCLICSCVINVRAQSTPSLSGAMNEAWSAFSTATNWSLAGSYAHSITGTGKNIAAADLAYNFNANVGVIVGYENLWSGRDSQASTVKGGVTLSATVHPFAFIGSTFLTNTIATPYVSDLIATPKNGNAIGNLIVTGAKIDFYKFKNFELSVNVFLEVRSGQGKWDGKYPGAGLLLTRLF